MAHHLSGVCQSGDAEAHASLGLRFLLLLFERVDGAVDDVVHRTNCDPDVLAELVPVECLTNVVDVLHEVEAAQQTSTERRQRLLTTRVRRFDGLAVVEVVHLVDPVDEQDTGFSPVPRPA